jgi:hypothetical protein
MEWTSYDAVVLTAVALGGGGSLDRLLSTIDVCNHDVPPFEVVGPALARLVGAGLLERRKSGFRLTRSGRKLVRATQAGSIERVSEVRAHLATVPVSAEIAVLDRHDWDATVLRYSDGHRR